MDALIGPGGGGGGLRYLGYTGTCCWIGMVFWPCSPKQGIQFDLPLSKIGSAVPNRVWV